MAMQTYTPAQWVLIDAASQYGYDKELFPDRLRYGREFLEIMQCFDHSEPENIGEEMKAWIDKADEPEMFAKALLAISDILRGEPTGHIVGLDASNSGPQLLSVMCRCITGMKNTGPIDRDDKRLADLYSSVLEDMVFSWRSEVSKKDKRAMVKKATVPYVYGSSAEPKTVFGETGAQQFEGAYETAVPWAYWARKTILNCWNNEALAHRWPLPDGFVSHNIVQKKMSWDKVTYKGVSFKFERTMNMPKIRGEEEGTSSLAANVTHSMDAYIVRELQRRCNYDEKTLRRARKVIKKTLEGKLEHTKTNKKLADLVDYSFKFNMISLEGAEHISYDNLKDINHEYLEWLLAKVEKTLEYPSFYLRTIHDEYACSPNHINRMKQTYNDLLVELYDGSWLFDVIEMLSGTRHHDKRAKAHDVVRDHIRNNNYSIG